MRKKTGHQVKKNGLLAGYGFSRLFFLRLAAILISACLQPLLAAPYSFWPLHWIAWIPFLWAIHSQDGRGNMLLAFTGGTLSNLLIFYWVINLLPNFTNISLPVSVILVVMLCAYQGILWMVLAWLIPIMRNAFPRMWLFTAPALLVTVEFLMPQLFPYMQGVSHYQVIPVIQLSSLTGIYGVSYLLFWANCVLYNIMVGLKEKRTFHWKQSAMLLLVVSLVLAYGFLRIHEYRIRLPQAEKLKVGLIQSNLTTDETAEMGLNQIHNIYLDLSHRAVERGAGWIVWSEGEFHVPLNTDRAEVILKQTSRDLNRPILLGGYGYRRIKGETLATNSAVHVDPVKGLGKRYDKQVLVPFGEYMPFEKYLSFIYKKINWTSRFFPGSDSVVQEIQKVPYAFLICYEAIFPSLARRAVNLGARILVNITYDAWFGRTSAPHQHLMLATIRSAEMGVPLIRLATTGISTTVNALGKSSDLSTLFSRQVLLHEVPLVFLPTLYSRIGDLFAWICLCYALTALGAIYIKTRGKILDRGDDRPFKTDSQN